MAETQHGTGYGSLRVTARTPPYEAAMLIEAALRRRGTFETSYAGVYAIGDVTTVPLAMGKPLLVIPAVYSLWRERELREEATASVPTRSAIAQHLIA